MKMKMKTKMYKALIIPVLFAGMVACGPQNKEKTTAEETITEADGTNHYGDKITADDRISTADLLIEMASADSLDTKVEGKILKTCAKKGCWMNIDIGNGQHMRVTFENYGFFVPTEGVEGKTAIMQGQAKKVVTSVDALRHFAEDAGKSEEEINAITEPKEEITFVATGVIIEE